MNDFDATNTATRANRARGFSTLWRVERSYAVREGLLEVAEFGDPPRRIAPAGMPALVGAVANLSDAGEAEFIQFAKRFGLLGYGWLVEKPHAPEPVGWIRAHANGLRTALDLHRLIASRDEGKLRHYLDELRTPVPRRNIGPRYSPVVKCGRGGDPSDFFVMANEAPPADMARALIQQVMNPNLERIRYELQPVPENGESPPGSMHLRLRGRALLDIAYWQAAAVVAGDSRVGCCQECGTYFVKTHGRERFCPEDVGGESRCQKRHAMRRLRAKGKGS